MLSSWITFTALLAVSVIPRGAATGQGALSVAPTRRVKGHPEAQLALNCGDRKAAGLVQYWHTPFGELHSHGLQSKLDPVFMHRDGHLVIPNSSALHSGLYYCLLQHTGGTTLWPYELRIGRNHQKAQEHEEQSSSCATIGFSRDAGSEVETPTRASNQVFAGAVAASVLLTFVLGFSIGALSRPHILRCFGVLTKRLRLSRQQTDTVDSGSQLPVSAVPPMAQGFEMEQMQDNDSVNCTSIDTTASSTASSPLTKPQRNFTPKRQKQQEIVAYLEGFDNRKEDERQMEEETKRCEKERKMEKEAGWSVDENKICTDEEGEKEEGGSHSKIDDKCSKDRGERDGGQSREEKENQQEEEEEVEVHENKSKDEGEQGRQSEEKQEEDEDREEEGWRDEKEEDDREKINREGGVYRDSQSSTETEDSRTQEGTENNGIMGGGGGDGAPPPPPCPARRSRVIRLYQFDEDGQRYGHLPEPPSEDPGPAPRPRQRTRSLTRLSAIMAAASAGPLDRQEPRSEEKEDRAHFHMHI